MAKQLNVNLAFTADTAQAKMQLQDLQKTLTGLVKQPAGMGIGGKITEELQKASVAAAELQLHLKEATNADTGTLDYSKLNQSLKQSGKTLQSYASQLRNMGPEGQKAFMQLADSVAMSEIPLRRSNTALKEMATTLKNTARWQISSSILHSFMGSIQSAYGYAQKLNRSLNDIRIVTGNSIEEMKKFAEQANRSAKALSTTTNEYTKASLIFYQQGLSDAEVQKRTDITIKLANASQQSAEIVSDQLTSVWNNFSTGSESLERYADVLTALGAETASSTEEIATGMQKFSAVTRQIGLSYDYAAAALATVTATTRESAETVGTAFKTIFSRMEGLKLGETLDDGTTLNQYSEALAAVGVNIKNSNGELKDMDDILNDTASVWSKLSRDQQVALAQSVAGIRQYNQFIALMDNWNFMEENLKTAKNATGTLQKQADIYAESWEAASKRVTAAAEDLYTKFLNDEFFIDLLNMVESLITGFSKLVDTAGGFAGVLTQVGAILTRIYAKDISKGMRNMAYNFQMSTGLGRERLEQEREQDLRGFANTMAQSAVASGSVEEKEIADLYTTRLQVQSDFAAQAKNLTDRERERAQILLDQLKTQTDQTIELKKQILLAKEQRDSVVLRLHSAAVQGQSFSAKNTGESLRNISFFDQLKNNMNISEKDWEQMTQEDVDKMRKGFFHNLQKMRSDTKLSEENKQVWESIWGSAAHIDFGDYDSIMGLMGKIEAQKKSYVETIADQISGGDPALRKKVLADLLEYSVLTQGINTKNKEAKVGLDNVATSADGVRQSFQNGGKGISDWATRITSLSSGIMSLTSAFQLMGNIWDTISNPDLSGWDKFWGILTSLGMLIPQLIMTITSLSAALKGLSVQTIKDSGAKVLNTLATWLNTKAKKANAQATDQVEKETREDTQATNENTASQVSNAAARKINKNTNVTSGKGKFTLSKGTIPKGNGSTSNATGGFTFSSTDLSKSNIVKPNSGGSGTSALNNFTSALKNNAGALKGVAAKAGAVAAAIAIIVTTVKLAQAQINRYTEEAQKAQEIAESARNAANAAEEEYSNSKQLISDYSEGVKGLESLTKGTLEYKEAMREANETAMDLIKSHKDLKYEIKDGQIVIADEELERIQEEDLKKQIAADNAADYLEYVALEKQLKADQVEFARKNLSTDDEGWMGAGNIAVATGAGAGAGALLGTIVPGVGNTIGAAVGAIVGALAGLVTGAVTQAQVGIQDSEEIDALNRLANLYEKDNTIFANLEDTLRNKLQLDDEALIQSLLKNASKTEELTKEMAANNAQKDTMYDTAAAEIIANSSLTNSEAGQMAAEAGGRVYGEEYEKKLKEYQEKAAERGMFNTGTSNSKATWERYAKETGLDKLTNYKVTNYVGDGTVEYSYLKDGQEEVVRVTSEQIAAQLASNDIQNELINSLNLLREEIQRQIDAGKHDIANFLSEGNFDNVQVSEYKTMQQTVTDDNGEVNLDKVKTYLEVSGIDNDKAKELGYTDLDTLATAWKNTMNNIELSTDQRINTEFSDQFTVGSVSGTKRNLDIGGQVYADIFNEIASAIDFDLKSEEGKKQSQEFLQKLAQIDATSWDAAQEYQKLVLEYGGILDLNNTQLAANINELRALGDSIPTTQEILDSFNKVKSIAEEMQYGEIISKEDYDILVAYNIELAKYFSAFGDGYKIVGDYYNLLQEIEGAANEEMTSTIKATITQIENTKESIVNTQSRAIADTAVFSDAATDIALGAEASQYLYTHAYGAEMGEGRDFDADKKVALNSLNTLKDLYAEDGAISNSLMLLKASGEYTNDEIKQFYGDFEATRSEIDGWISTVSSWDGSKDASQEFNAFMESIGSTVSAYDTTQYKDFDITTKINGLEKQLQEQQNQLALNTKDKNERQRLLDKGIIDEDAHALGSLQEINAEKYRDLDMEEVDNYTLSIMAMAKSSELLDDNLNHNKNTAKDVAAAAMKLNRGIETLASNFEEWGDILSNSDSSSQEFAESMGEVKDAMSDVLGVSKEWLSDEFILHNLEDIEKAANGDADAIDRLSVAAAKDILINMDFESDEAKSKALQLHDEVANLIGDIEIGANINFNSTDPGYQQLMQNMADIVTAAEMNVDEANAYFRTLGFEAEFDTEEATIPLTGTRTVTEIQEEDIETVGGHFGGLIGGYTYPKIVTTYTEEIPSGTQTVQVPKLYDKETGKPSFSLKKVSSGAMNNSSSANRGGKSSSNGSKAKKQKPTKKQDIVERYKETEDALDDIRDAANKVNSSIDRLYGAKRAAAMKQNNKLLNDELVLLKQKYKEALEYQKVDRKALDKAAKEAGVELTIDENGNVTNYTDAMTSLYQQLNAAENKMNTFTDSDAQSDYQETHVQPIQDAIDNLKDAMATDEETRELLEDLDTEIQEKLYEIQDSNYEILNYEIEFKIEANDAELETLEYYLGLIEDDVYQSAESAALGIEQLNVYTNGLTNSFDAIEQLNKAYEAGEISQADYIEGLKTQKSELIDNVQSIQDLNETFKTLYEETISNAQEEMEKYTSQIEHGSTVLDHYSTLLELTGQAKNYTAFGEILDAKVDNMEATYNSSKDWYDMLVNEEAMAQQRLNDAIARGANEAEISVLEDQLETITTSLQEAEDQWLSDAEAWAEAFRERLENTLEQLRKSLEDALSGGLGFDYLTQKMDRQQSLQEEYLTTTNKIYETTKLMRTAQDQIDKTTNTVAKNKLKAFQDETKQLQNQTKLSNFELELQQKKYDLLLAEIALEEARNAKSTVRLQRDSEGNFGYVYTASEEQVSGAQQQYDDAENALYNFRLEATNEYASKSVELRQQMVEEMSSIWTAYLEGEISTEEEARRRMTEVQMAYFQLLDDNSSLYALASSEDARVLEEAWSSNIEEMTNLGSDWKYNVEAYLTESEEAIKDFDESVYGIAQKTGTTLDTLSGKVEGVSNKSKELSTTITNKVVPSLQKEFVEIDELNRKYADQYGKVQEFIDQSNIHIEKIDTIAKSWGAVGESLTNTANTKNIVVGAMGSIAEAANAAADAANAAANAIQNVFDVGSKEDIKTIWDDTTKQRYNKTGITASFATAQSDVMAPKGSLDKGATVYTTAETGPYGTYYKLYSDSKKTKFLAYAYSSGLTWVEGKKEKQAKIKFDTGGYTGEWGPEGKWALLHEKELILNKGQTADLLSTIQVMDNILTTIDRLALGNTLTQIQSAKYTNNTTQLDQNIKIEANFPNVSSREEIEAAFTNLVNEAAQYANRK